MNKAVTDGRGLFEAGSLLKICSLNLVSEHLLSNANVPGTVQPSPKRVWDPLRKSGK